MNDVPLLSCLLLVLTTRPFYETQPRVRDDSYCDPPKSSVPLRKKPQDRRLAGTYKIELVATDSAHRAQSVSGELTLRVTPARNARAPNHRIVIPYYGFTDLDINRFKGVIVAHPLDRTYPDDPGVQFVYNTLDTTTSIILGNSVTPRGVSTDVGVFLFIRNLTDSSMAGVWKASSLRSNAPEGYFCIARLS
jgi:hypothetical protein